MNHVSKKLLSAGLVLIGGVVSLGAPVAAAADDPMTPNNPHLDPSYEPDLLCDTEQRGLPDRGWYVSLNSEGPWLWPVPPIPCDPDDRRRLPDMPISCDPDVGRRPPVPPIPRDPDGPWIPGPLIPGDPDGPLVPDQPIRCGPIGPRLPDPPIPRDPDDGPRLPDPPIPRHPDERQVIK